MFFSVVAIGINENMVNETQLEIIGTGDNFYIVSEFDDLAAVVPDVVSVSGTFLSESIKP